MLLVSPPYSISSSLLSTPTSTLSVEPGLAKLGYLCECSLNLFNGSYYPRRTILVRGWRAGWAQYLRLLRCAFRPRRPWVLRRWACGLRTWARSQCLPFLGRRISRLPTAFVVSVLQAWINANAFFHLWCNRWFNPFSNCVPNRTCLPRLPRVGLVNSCNLVARNSRRCSCCLLNRLTTKFI